MGIHHITAIAGEPQRSRPGPILTFFSWPEPGGVLFELATDAPGFTIDEPAADLGARLMLPPWYEGRRRQIEDLLPALRLPQPSVRQENEQRSALLRSFFSYADCLSFALVDIPPYRRLSRRLASPAPITCRSFARRTGDAS